jgi:hypothetical protein
MLIPKESLESPPYFGSWKFKVLVKEILFILEKNRGEGGDSRETYSPTPPMRGVESEYAIKIKSQL